MIDAPRDDVPGFLQSHRAPPEGWRRATAPEAEALLLTSKHDQYLVPKDALKPGLERVWVNTPGHEVLAPAAGRWVSLRACDQCGEWWPVLEDDEEARCPTCRQPYTPGDTVSGAMAELRWKLDQYQHEASAGERDKVRASAIALRDCAWLVAPTLLRELERLYGNQLVARTRAMERGDAPQPETSDGEQAPRVRDSVSSEGDEGCPRE